MKKSLSVLLVMLWTVLVAVAATGWGHRKDDRIAGSVVSKADSIELFVDPHLRLEGEPWMFSSLRMSKGRGIGVKREDLAEGTVRIVVTDANTFGGDTVTIDLTKAPNGSVQAMARVNWERDIGPPFEGSWHDLVGGVTLSSAALQESHPVIIEFTLNEKGGDYPGCEHGVVSVP